MAQAALRDGAVGQAHSTLCQRWRFSLHAPVLQVVHRVITRHLLGQAGLKADEADRQSADAVLAAPLTRLHYTRIVRA